MRRLALALLLVAGCSSKQEPKNEFVPIADVEPGLVTIAQKTLPNVKFDRARKIHVNGEEVFEIRGKMPNGKIREVEVSASGKVVEVE